MKDDPEERRERGFDTVTFLLAGLLATIIIAAVGYGIFNSSRATIAVPAATAGLEGQRPTLAPLNTTGAH
jgi:Tfp pilus assembly protein PilW